MKKRTIGKFIAILRKANGMTQKELGEKLYVSDKTISRWENDESTPELSLIPQIAEIFEITADELLRGERNLTQNNEINTNSKNEKQWKILLHRQFNKYKNMSFISIGIICLGILVAMIFNFGFICSIVGFFSGCTFLVIGCICQLCFTNHSLIPLDNDNEIFHTQIRKFNTQIIEIEINVIRFIILVLAFLLPLLTGGAYYRIKMKEWIIFGGICVVITAIIISFVHPLFIQNELYRKDFLYYGKKIVQRNKQKYTLLGKIYKIGIIITIIIGICYVGIGLEGQSLFLKPEKFYTYEEFKNHMSELAFEYPGTNYTKIVKDEDGNIITSYVYDPDSRAEITFSENYSLPITVISSQTYRKANEKVFFIHISLIILEIINILGCMIYYFREGKKMLKYLSKLEKICQNKKYQ